MRGPEGTRASGVELLRRGLGTGGGVAESLNNGLGFLRRGCWLDPMGPESVWRGRDPEIAAPGMISFLAFLSRPQTSGGLRWGRVGLEKGLWIVAHEPLSACPPSNQAWLSSWLVPISSAERLARFRGCQRPRPMPLDIASLTVECFQCPWWPVGEGGWHPCISPQDMLGHSCTF